MLEAYPQSALAPRLRRARRARLPAVHPPSAPPGRQGSARLPYVQAAGFTDVALDDRNDWFRDYARDECERLKGPLFDTYVARFGAAQARQSGENARIRALLADEGQLRPGHIRARKPATA